MNVAILAVSSLSLACSAGSLYFLYKTAKKLDETTTKVKTDVQTFKEKTNRNLGRVKMILGEMEL